MKLQINLTIRTGRRDDKTACAKWQKEGIQIMFCH